jgi:hypothetical protein
LQVRESVLALAWNLAEAPASRALTRLTAFWVSAGVLAAGPAENILRRWGREIGYVFFPIPNHLRIFAIRPAIGRVYAVSPIVSPIPSYY